MLGGRGHEACHGPLAVPRIKFRRSGGLEAGLGPRPERQRPAALRGAEEEPRMSAWHSVEWERSGGELTASPMSVQAPSCVSMCVSRTEGESVALPFPEDLRCLGLGRALYPLGVPLH